ncbi:MAG: small multi-drug export protein [Clostridia bacterium]|nr:small multi-drug export protein [Clostridia bacterium]
MLTFLKNPLVHVFLISMVPLIELRGGIIWGAANGLGLWENMIACIIGNMIPVPFILLFIRKILELMKKIPKLDKIALWVEAKADKNKDKVTKYATWGLLLFVGVPLPGTGAWTGALVAAMMNMRMKYALPSILGGVILASVIMSLGAYGVVSAFAIFS